ncbi:helicase associated domain-containing protein [Mycobacterium lacus]|uniref:helicase associated domain-containing protein n=1 Tax=Mycobacterium lacus TaxID=169765 RepID=UPI003B8A92C6
MLSRFGIYAQRRSRRGTSQVPIRFVTEDGFQLGQWVNTVRSRKKTGSLRTEYAKQLEELPRCTWTPKADKWGRADALLPEYVNEPPALFLPRVSVAPWCCDGGEVGRSGGSFDRKRARRAT